MDGSLQSMLKLYVFSTGRRLFALAQVMKAANQRSFPELETHCAAAIKHDRNTRALEMQWAAPAQRPAAVQPIDVRVDRTLVAIRDVAQAHADAEEDDDDVREGVRAMVTTIFPQGVQAVIQLPYVEQLSAMDAILESLKGKKLASLVADLGLTRNVKLLAKQVAEYRVALESPAPESIAWERVRVARATGQDLLLQAVAMILAKYRTSSAEDVAARNALLGPVLVQNEAIRLYLRNRRSVQDVNPDTGAVDPNAPVGEAGDAASPVAPVKP